MQIGYNYQLQSRFVLGAEADISFPYFVKDGAISTKATAQSTVTDKVDDIGTLRGRFGYAFDHWLIYGTGGFARSRSRFVESPGLANNEDKVLRTRTGWTLGIGAEVAVTPDWTAKLEYLYDRFGSVAALFPSGRRYTSVFDIHTLRLGPDRQLRRSHADAPSIPTGEPPTAQSSNWNIHGQFTFVEQGYSAFRSPYEGSQSLSGASQAKNTVSATAFLGLRLWDGAELYFNPEIDQGFGLNTRSSPTPDTTPIGDPFRFSLDACAQRSERRSGVGHLRSRPHPPFPSVRPTGSRPGRGSSSRQALIHPPGSRSRTTSMATPIRMIRERTFLTGTSMGQVLTTGPWTKSPGRGALLPS